MQRFTRHDSNKAKCSKWAVSNGSRSAQRFRQRCNGFIWYTSDW